ncbi:MAG: type II CRISPR-associated endonuclease Cas1 [Bacteroidales bacterium]|nr:type II CRISPR-associated endonuclease Cas1 [Candidatus Colimorpha merdihippi]
MIKRTLCFNNPAMLSLNNGQLVVKLLDPSAYNAKMGIKHEPTTTIPIEDIGILLLDHPQITLTHGVMNAMLENNVAIITCNNRHLPTGLTLPLDGNTLQSERFRDQINASLPLKKQLWQQTVAQKIRNQAAVLKQMCNTEVGNMLAWSQKVKSGDADNLEGRAAAYYWSCMFPNLPGWTRGQEGDWPNALFNYGYAILRAMVARALVSSGLLPTLGIHHHNRYNAYCLADDIMEPYRPYVDQLVLQMLPRYPNAQEISKEMKADLLQLPVADVVIGGQRSPMMVAISQTTASLYKCFSGEMRKIAYPEIDML